MGVDYNPSIVIDGLVGCWDVASPRSSPGEGTTWTDLSKNGNDGTLTNGPITAEGINKGIISFDGTDDYVSIGSLSNFDASTGSFEAWVNCAALPTNNNAATIWSNWSSSNDRTYLFIYNNGGTLQWSFFGKVGGVTHVDVANLAVPEINTWYHVVATWDTSVGSYIYIDTVKGSLGTYSSAPTQNTHNIGQIDTANSNYQWGGNIVLSRFYDRVLTESEIKQNYNATKGRFSVTPSIVTENLVLHLDAGDSDSYPGTGTTWTDLSGNGNDATLTNGPVYSGSVGGGSFLFDGSDDYAVDTNPTGFTVNHTVSMWIYFSVLDIYRYLLDMGSSHVNWIEITPGGKARSGTNGSGTYCDTSSTMSTGTWYNITRLYNGTSNKVYINSVEECSNTTSNTATPSQIVIGNHGGLGSTNCFSGYVACVYVYSRALTSGEILQNYEAQKGRFV